MAEHTFKSFTWC